MIDVAEPKKIQDAIDRARAELPAEPRVVDVRFEMGDDSTGDPAVFVLTLLDETTSDADWISEKLRPIERGFRRAIVATGTDRFVYVRFARPSDLKQNGAGG